MKDLTLNQTWTLCLRMWRWIAKECETSIASVGFLKEKWMRNNGYEEDEIWDDCFFCECASKIAKSKTLSKRCPKCPAKKVNRQFHCMKAKYNYQTEPKAFYAELLRLNRIRKGKK